MIEFFRILKWFLLFVGGILILIIGSPLLAVLGRTRTELVVDDELLNDDPGVDVDQVADVDQGPP